MMVSSGRGRVGGRKGMMITLTWGTAAEAVVVAVVPVVVAAVGVVVAAVVVVVEVVVEVEDVEEEVAVTNFTGRRS